MTVKKVNKAIPIRNNSNNPVLNKKIPNTVAAIHTNSVTTNDFNFFIILNFQFLFLKIY